ncbi:hypothetical protein MSAS_17130 [Mycobacterium saskatchewanense]|uniref:SnoaL-like domain-containing protein n=1 Tax=Mycobacterium saskatchewanense TaxID=220927 RepID=A0AAJ3TW18_9MYCO|nr:nuclear transport factor 2 family protein [Mycobacterium saskatchewanense]ORW72931.1 hypothetical protein AWC23_08740 [Mycobacterium saskatchewanense]BBX62539.1 hypothetical protein MSAS_17130 [Mycobacterium saskatchewanense]
MTLAASDIELNKDIALEWTRALLQGDGSAFRKLTHPDFVATLSGDMRASGTRNIGEFVSFMDSLRREQFAPGEFTMAIGAVTAEAERVVIEAESRIPLRNGGLYNNHYIWSFRIRDHKVVRFTEVMDTLHVHTVLVGAEFVHRRTRANLIFDQPTRVITGEMAPPR